MHLSTPYILAFFNLFTGLMLTLSLVFFIGGFIIYLVRLGTWPTYREDAVELMKWGVSILFTLILILGVQQFLLSHLLVAGVIVAAFIIGLIVWAFWPEPPPKPRPEGDRRG